MYVDDGVGVFLLCFYAGSGELNIGLTLCVGVRRSGGRGRDVVRVCGDGAAGDSLAEWLRR
jgi:hypothetical protein